MGGDPIVQKGGGDPIVQKEGGGAGPSNISPIAILHYTFKSC